MPKDKNLTVELGKEKPLVIENFDFGADYTIIENPKKTMVSAKFFGAAYSRPQDVSTASFLPTRAKLMSNYSRNIRTTFAGRHRVWRSESSRIHQ
jgi:hypothetical protein